MTEAILDTNLVHVFLPKKTTATGKFSPNKPNLNPIPGYSTRRRRLSACGRHRPLIF